MRLFTCKKYDFVVKKNLPSLPNRLSPSTQNQGNSGTTLPELSKHLPMGWCLGRVVGFKTGFQLEFNLKNLGF
ncbi:hypothetical protein [Leptospira alexanderi]|uniref:hypothetical protein n=1 Tax=Leptospira alexanderi TaxID=100053 RepID=UPI0015918DB5|nr:hypothetical protein [Leptospira alexanderi]